MCAPLSLVHRASLWLVVGGMCRLLATTQVGDDDNSAEHGNGDTVAEILADADGDVHLRTSLHQLPYIGIENVYSTNTETDIVKVGVQRS